MERTLGVCAASRLGCIGTDNTVVMSLLDIEEHKWRKASVFPCRYKVMFSQKCLLAIDLSGTFILWYKGRKGLPVERKTKGKKMMEAGSFLKQSRLVVRRKKARDTGFVTKLLDNVKEYQKICSKE